MAFWSPTDQRTQTTFQTCYALVTPESGPSAPLRDDGLSRTCWCRLTDVISTITDVGRYLLHALAVQNGDLLGEGAGQLLVDGPGQETAAALKGDSSVPQRVCGGSD